jgi:small GTP-binding protein
MDKKIVMIGDTGVGKSTIVGKYITGIDYKGGATIGAAVCGKVMNDSGNKIYIWDTAGQERFRSICGNYYKGSYGCIVVFDITSKESYNNVSYWISQYATYCNRDNFQILILANKIDLDASIWQVSNDEITKLAKTYNCEVIMTSGISGNNADKFNLVINEVCDSICNENNVPINNIILTDDTQSSSCIC